MAFTSLMASTRIPYPEEAAKAAVSKDAPTLSSHRVRSAMTALSLADVTVEAAEPPLLNVSGLAKSFGAQVACRDISFALWPGEVLGVVGESGSGKTTLL